MRVRPLNGLWVTGDDRRVTSWFCRHFQGLDAVGQEVTVPLAAISAIRRRAEPVRQPASFSRAPGARPGGCSDLPMGVPPRRCWAT